MVISTPVREELSRHGVLDRVSGALGSRLGVGDATPDEIRAQAEALPAGTFTEADLSVLALSERLGPDIVLTDDLALRRAVLGRGHTVSGSVGVLFRAYGDGAMSKEALRAAADALFTGSTLYLSRGFWALVQRMVEDA